MLNKALLLLDGEPCDPIWGCGITEAPFAGEEVTTSIGTIIGFGINIIFVLAAFFVLVYLLWGAFDVITAGGDSEKFSKARGKIVHAIVGMLLLVLMLTVWIYLSVSVFGIVSVSEGGFSIPIPRLGKEEPEEREPIPLPPLYGTPVPD